MKQDGCKSLYILNDKEVYGAGLATNIETSAKEEGIRVLANEGIDPKAPNYRSLASKISDANAGCFVFSGITQNNAVQVYKDVAAATDADLYGPDGVAEAVFFDPNEGGIPANVARRTTITVATLSKEEYERLRIPARRFFDAYEKEYDEPDPDPYAIFGFETMSLILDAIERAGDEGNDRTAVRDAIFATKGRDSVLGKYDIDQNGDSTITDYGVYTIEGGKLVFDRRVAGR
jgi:branched-chain amino acid transport system substrate-binding protein